MQRDDNYGDGALVDRLTRLRQAHEVLAHELGSAQRRLREREREVRELRAALDAYRTIRAPMRGGAALSEASRAA